MDFFLLAEPNRFIRKIISDEIKDVDLLIGSKIPSQYLLYVEYLFKSAISMNDNGRYFPIWATCLGFESMLIVLSDRKIEISDGLKDINLMHQVVYDREKKSVLNQVFTEEDFKFIETQPLLYFYHDFGYLLDKTSNDPYVKENIDILAKMTCVNGEVVVAAIKHKKYPFIGVQYHPEKNQFVYTDALNNGKTSLETDVGRKHAKAFRILLGDITSSIDNNTVLSYKYQMQQTLNDGTQNEVYYFASDLIRDRVI